MKKKNEKQHSIPYTHTHSTEVKNIFLNKMIYRFYKNQNEQSSVRHIKQSTNHTPHITYHQIINRVRRNNDKLQSHCKSYAPKPNYHQQRRAFSRPTDEIHLFTYKVRTILTNNNEQKKKSSVLLFLFFSARNI